MEQVQEKYKNPLADGVITNKAISLELPKYSGWQCYMFGNRPGEYGLVYRPKEGMEPNRFVRWMMKVCFDCLWVNDSK